MTYKVGTVIIPIRGISEWTNIADVFPEKRVES